MKKDERRALKEWLTALLPEGMSRNDVADELGFSRKTISTMLNPAQSGFGNGLTLLSYLRFVGAVVDAPAESPGASRLAAIEAKVQELPTRDELRSGLDTLRVAIHALANPDSDQGHSADSG